MWVPRPRLPESAITGIVTIRGNEMGVRIKPVEPTVIKDKKIIRQVIAEIHRKPTKKDLARLQEGREVLKRAMEP